MRSPSGAYGPHMCNTDPTLTRHMAFSLHQPPLRRPGPLEHPGRQLTWSKETRLKAVPATLFIALDPRSEARRSRQPVDVAGGGFCRGI